MPIENPDEMGLPIKEAVERLNKNSEYRKLFDQVFKQNPSKENLAAALSAFEKTLETVDSKLDEWSNNITKLSPQEEAGRQLFVGDKIKCFDCHSMEDFTDDEYKNIGLYNGMFTTLEQVIDYYNNPGIFVNNPINIDTALQQPLGLTEKEKKNLVAFLKTLTDKKFRK